MMIRVEPTMHRLRPFTGYVTVIESDVDEEQRKSGLIVPLGGSSLRRGVVLHVSADAQDSLAAALLPEGTVVYFQHGETVADVVIVPLLSIVAYVEDER